MIFFRVSETGTGLVPKMLSVDHKESANGCQVIHGYFSLMVTLSLMIFKRKYVWFVKII